MYFSFSFLSFVVLFLNIRDRHSFYSFVVICFFILILWVELVVRFISFFSWVWSRLLQFYLFILFFLFNKFHVITLCLA